MKQRGDPSHDPPKLAIWLVWVSAPFGRQSEWVGDHVENYRIIVAATSIEGARRWSIREALATFRWGFPFWGVRLAWALWSILSKVPRNIW